jgi:FtsP/CotA-like multicopper oxidase with cupredoxin domain
LFWFTGNLEKYAEIEFTNRDTYRSHPCMRPCVKGQHLTCFYEFVIEEFETMSKACYNCPINETDCFRPHCVSADGMKRSIVVVNRMMPGPSIEVCLNDTINVEVKNRLMSEGTTIHWHGIHQRSTPYMDGVPHVSQCAILPGQNFRYNFQAENSGTHFWHSHLGLQRGDGVYGALVVRNSEEPHEDLYDFDMTEHILITNDWTHTTSVSVFTAHHHGRGDNKPSNILINGRGKYFGNMTAKSEQKMTREFKIEVVESEMAKEEITTEEEITTTQENQEETTSVSSSNENDNNSDDYRQTTQKTIVEENKVKSRSKRALMRPDDDSPLVPYEIFNVVKGQRYRFRHVNAGFLNCPIEISIDNHTITAIATDGNSLQPVEATFLVTYAGERWDFIVNANQQVGNYFIRARGLMDCDERFTSSFQMAVLHYHGAEDENPSRKPSYQLSREGLALNALNRPFGQKGSMTVAEMKTAENRANKIMKVEPDFKFYLSYDFYAKDNPLFHLSNLYGFNQVPFGRIYTPQLNHITMKMPSTPAMMLKGLLDSTFCNETSLAAQGVNCKETFCECTHVLQVPLNSVVEMVLIDEGVTYDANHMFHLHGNSFHVVGMDRLGSNVTLQEVKELDKLGRLKRKFLDSPQKDTVTVPDGGYTIIRFYADNPGSKV